MTSHDAKAEIEALLQQADCLPYGPEELALVHQAADLAAEAGDEDLEYRARMHLTDSASMAGDTDTKLSSFAWCLAKHDSDPDRFAMQIASGSDLMWQYKWMCGSLDRSVAFPLEQTEALLDDMERRYSRAGLGMSAVLSERFSHAWATGNLEEAKRLRTLLESTPRDDYSDCEACGRSQLAGFAALLGEDSVALNLIDEITAGSMCCADEPEFALARTLLVKLRAGRLEDAKASHLRSYQLARTDIADSQIVASNLAFCAITGNESRALAMTERHLSWLAHDALNDVARLSLLAAIGLALQSVSQAGHGDQVVRGADRPELAAILGPADGRHAAVDPGSSGAAAPLTAVQLLAQVEAAANALAAAFDARNGNDFVSRQLAATRTLIEHPYSLPIQPNVFVALPRPPAEPADTPGLLELAQSCQALNLWQRQITLADQILALTSSHTPDSGNETDDSANKARLEAHRIKLSGLAALGQTDQAAEVLAERLADLCRLGLESAAGVEELAGLALYQPDSDEAARSGLREALSRAGQDPDLAEVEVRLALKLALLSLNDDDSTGSPAGTEALLRIVEAKSCVNAIDRARAWAIRAHGLCDTPAGTAEALAHGLDLELPRGVRASYLYARARALGTAGQFAEAAANADEATQLNAELGLNGPGARSAELAALLLEDDGRSDQALGRLRYAVRLNELEEGLNPSAKFHLGRLLYGLDQDFEAAELFTDVLEIERRQQAAPEFLADTLEWLGKARHACGHLGSALDWWNDSAGKYLEADRVPDAVRVCWRKGNLFRQAEDYDSAIEEFDQAMELLEQIDWRSQADFHADAITVLEARALAKGEAGQDDAVADVEQARGVAISDEATWRAADLIDTRARIDFQLGRLEDAVAHFLEAADAYRAAGDRLAAARSEHLMARLLSKNLSRPDDARSILQTTLRDLAALPPDAAADATGLLEAIEATLAELA
jgi:tetratricopeptide (TPR) repeat protein